MAIADKLQKLIDGKQYVVDKTNAKAGTSLNIKSKWKELGDAIEGIESGGASIEEVDILPEATAENVGKIYKYQGELYECKEYKNVGDIDPEFGVMGLASIMGLVSDFEIVIKNIHYVDSEPNLEDTLFSSENEFEVYVLNDGTDMFITVYDEEKVSKIPLTNIAQTPLLGLINKFPKPNEIEEPGFHLIHFYYFEQRNDDITKMLWEGMDYSKMIIRVPKSVSRLSNPYTFFGTIIKELIFEGNIYLMDIGNMFDQSGLGLLRTVDLSKVEFVPLLINNKNFTYQLTCTIKVPQALLEEFKSATNWSTYADLMVGV